MVFFFFCSHIKTIVHIYEYYFVTLKIIFLQEGWKMKRKRGKVISIQYIHNPEAAQRWMEIIIEHVTQEVIKTTKYKEDKTDINIL
jgi:hypothetical protein